MDSHFKTSPIGVPEIGRGSHGEEPSPSLPPTGQRSLPFDKHERLLADHRNLYALAAAMVRKAGGVEWLAAALDREPSYGSKISEGLNERNGKHFQLDWLAPLLDDADASDLLMGWLCERLGYEPPVRVRRDVSEADFARAARELIAEMDPDYAAVQRRKLAKKLGVRIQDVKL